MRMAAAVAPLQWTVTWTLGSQPCAWLPRKVAHQPCQPREDIRVFWCCRLPQLTLLPAAGAVLASPVLLSYPCLFCRGMRWSGSCCLQRSILATAFAQGGGGKDWVACGSCGHQQMCQGAGVGMTVPALKRP